VVAGLVSAAGHAQRPEQRQPPEAVFLALLNDWRLERTLAPVVADDRLTRAADAHARDMAAGVGCSHTGKDGSSFGDRARAQGYPAASGEVLACGVADPRGALDLLLGSNEHRTILSDRDHRHVGVARAEGMWAIVLGRDRSILDGPGPPR
jgi:uncharacterized protein YkwD